MSCIPGCTIPNGCSHCEPIIAARDAEIAELVRAAGAFLVKMNEVHQHPRYRRVWETAQVIDGPYDGPTYIDEHEALCIALRKAGAR